MARTRELKIIIAGDADKLDRAVKQSRRSIDDLGKQTRLTASVTSKGFHGMRAAATGVTAALGGLALGAKSFLDKASDINESLTKNQALFGKYAKGIENYSLRTARSIGVSRREALAAAGTFGGLFDAINIGEKQSARMSRRLVTLAADLASFNNASPEEALEALRSGLAGEAEPMRRFNAFLSETRVQAEAMRLGIGKAAVDTDKLRAAQLSAEVAQQRYNVAVQRYGRDSAEAKSAQVSLINAQERASKATKGGNVELTEAQKVQARYSLILRDTEKAQGDFAKTKDGDANQTRILRAQYEDITAQMGDKMLPAKLKVTRALNKFIGEMQDGTGQGGRFVDTLKDIWTEVEPVVQWVGRATKNVAEFAAEHPKVTKLAVEVLAVGAAIKGLRIASAATGFTDLVKVARGAARTMKSVIVRRAAEAGTEAAAETAASYQTGSVVGGKFRKAGRAAGTRLGKGLVVGVIAGLALAGPEIIKWWEESPFGKPEKFLEKTAKRFAKGILGAIGIGDGTGKSPPRGKAGNLMGARGSLAPYAAIGAGYGLHVTSGKRPGAITSSGNQSYHSTGEAVDIAGPANRMLAFARRLKGDYGPRLAELIYTPMGAGIKNGRPHRYTGQVAEDHYDHVHVAVDTGKPGVGDGLGKGQIVNLWTRAGGSATTSNLAAAVAMAESGGRTDARNVNRDGSVDRGLWQINSVHGSLSTFSPLGNARAAVKISSGGRNWRPWVAYTSGAYRKFLGGATGAGSRSSAEHLQSQVDRNQDRIDKLRDQLDQAPKGLAGAVQRDRIQSQIRRLQSQNRRLRGDLRDAPSAADIRESQERAGSRIVSSIVDPYMKGFRTTSRRAAGLAGQIEDDATRYGQAERLFGQTEEDLGTPAGRARRISEIGILAGLKRKTLERQKKRADALKKAIANRESMLKKLRAARGRAKGAKRSKMNERIRSYEESLDDLKAELHSLGFAIRDTELDIGDLIADAREVAQTPDTEVEAGPTIGDKLSQVTGDIDLKERAGLLTAEQARAQRIQAMQIALAMPGLSDRERWQIMGDLREAQQQATEAIVDNTSAIKDLQAELAKNTAVVNSILAVEYRTALAALADSISGQIVGAGVNARALTAGTGTLARY